MNCTTIRPPLPSAGLTANATAEQRYLGRPTLAITFGHNKDHRPDLKQLLYVLTTTADGAVPVWCSVDHGNTTDDQTHIATWDTLCRLVGRPDFLYVADSKLCTKENMAHLASRGGRFVTVLPASRREDAWFRDWLQSNVPTWVELLRHRNRRRKTGPDEVYRGFESPLRTVEGYRVLWIWSSQKHALDREARGRRIQQTIDELEQLRARMNSPRSRLKTCAQVTKAVAAILERTQAARWLTVEVKPIEEHRFTQAKQGRPGKHTKYVRRTHQRPELHWQSNAAALQYDDRTDGIFPLVVNDAAFDALELLHAYKRQPVIEKRFSQLKTDFEVAPVYLKAVHRIQAMLCMYFFALLIEALLERQLRQAMQNNEIEALPMYPEGRACRWPTAQRVIELFESVQRHTLKQHRQSTEVMVTELTRLQRKLLKLIGLPAKDYGR